MRLILKHLISKDSDIKRLPVALTMRIVEVRQVKRDLREQIKVDEHSDADQQYPRKPFDPNQAAAPPFVGYEQWLNEALFPHLLVRDPQQSPNIFFKLLRIREARIFLDYPTIAVDQKCGRIDINTSKLLLDSDRRESDRVLNWNLLSESRDCCSIFIERQPDDNKSAAAIFGIKLIEVRDFLTAGCAPSGPKIEERNLSSKRLRRNFAPANVSHNERWNVFKRRGLFRAT